MNRALAGIIGGVLAVSAPIAVSADTIVDIAVGNPEFSSLTQAVVAQDLATTLAGAGPFTVFAPNNAAFAKLPGFITRAITEKPALLKSILLYHVVPGDFDAGEVLSSRNLESVQGSRLSPNMRGSDAYINGSKIIATDVVADNGRIHVIDTVLIPRDVIIEAFRMELKRMQDDFRMLLDNVRGNGNPSH